MTTEIESTGAVVVARPEGPRLDLSTAEAFKASVTAVLGGEGRTPDRLVLDLGNIDYLDSAGLGALLSILKRARRSGIRVALKRARGEVRELLELTLVSRLFEVE